MPRQSTRSVPIKVLVRQHYKECSSQASPLDIRDVARALSITTQQVSMALHCRPDAPVQYIKVAPRVYYSTDEYPPKWDAAKAERGLAEHMARIGKPAKAKKAPEVEDWSQLFTRDAVVRALAELDARVTRDEDRNVIVDKGKEITEKIEPKLAEHKFKVTAPGQVITALRQLRDRLGLGDKPGLGWVDEVGGSPSRWGLTPKYWALTPEERDEGLLQWDKQVDPPVAEPEVLSVAAPAPAYHFEEKGPALGLAEGARVLVDLEVPANASAWERLAFLQVIMQIREDLLKYI